MCQPDESRKAAATPHVHVSTHRPSSQKRFACNCLPCFKSQMTRGPSLAMAHLRPFNRHQHAPGRSWRGTAPAARRPQRVRPCTPGRAASGTRQPRRSCFSGGEPWRRRSPRGRRPRRCSGPRRSREAPGACVPGSRGNQRHGRRRRRPRGGPRRASVTRGSPWRGPADGCSSGFAGRGQHGSANLRLSAAWRHLKRALQRLCDGQARNVAPGCRRPAASRAPGRTTSERRHELL